MDKALKELKKEMEIISGDWNGKDTKFQSGGTIYSEDHAGVASDIVERLDEVEGLLGDFREM